MLWGLLVLLGVCGGCCEVWFWVWIVILTLPQCWSRNLVLRNRLVNADEDARVVLLVELVSISAISALAARVNASARALDVEVDALWVELSMAWVAGAHKRESLGAENVWARKALWDGDLPLVAAVSKSVRAPKAEYSVAAWSVW